VTDRPGHLSSPVSWFRRQARPPGDAASMGCAGLLHPLLPPRGDDYMRAVLRIAGVIVTKRSSSAAPVSAFDDGAMSKV
jgi:hypothetical protein